MQCAYDADVIFVYICFLDIFTMSYLVYCDIINNSVLSNIVCWHDVWCQELSAYEVLQDFSETADDEIRDFLQIVARFVTNQINTVLSSLLLVQVFVIVWVVEVMMSWKRERENRNGWCNCSGTVNLAETVLVWTCFTKEWEWLGESAWISKWGC